MQEALRHSLIDALKRDYAFRKDRGDWLREGKCPSCSGRELYINAEKPWVLRCGRLNKCGDEWSVRDLYPDLFDNWSDRYKQTEVEPHAAAKAYLRDGRGLNTVKLADTYTQETYQDWKTGATSATVRFAMPCRYDGEGDGKPGFWERIIDRPQRFGKKKANMPKGWSYRGHAWHHPSLKMADFANAKEIWLPEGIFDARALQEAFDISRPGSLTASPLSTNNYPAEFVAAVLRAVKSGETSRPTLVFAFDVGPAGVSFTRKYVERARQEGWHARAAQVRPDGEGTKRDWNDLWQAGELTPEKLDDYLANGDITIAANPSEKAFLLWRRSKRTELHFIFDTRTFWAKFSAESINGKITQWAEQGEHADLSDEERHELAAQETVQLQEIANCAFRTLYFQRDEAIDESSYYLRVDFPGRQDRVKANFAGAAVSSGSEFKKRIISIAPGAIYTGNTHQLDKIMARQMAGIRTVDALYFSGYSREHGAWMFDDIAVKDGRIVPINDEDFFEIGKVGVKPHHANGDFQIPADDEVDYAWWDDFHLAFGTRGIVALSFWFLTLFAEQIRQKQQSLGFLEMWGEGGSGKSTLLIFLWKLLGRYDGYEGFDPSTATAAAIARQLVKYGNIPTVMLEGDRSTDQNHSKKFDWNELKKLYNGHSPRDRGVANAGVSTFAPRFRGGLVIAQNQPVRDTDTPVLERIMSIHFDKRGHTVEGKLASRRIEAADPAMVAGWIVQMIRREKAILELFWQRYDHHEKRLLASPEVQNTRLAHNHAQLAAALDCLSKAMTDGDRQVMSAAELQAGQDMIAQMCIERHVACSSDHPILADFWEKFDLLAERFDREHFTAGSSDPHPMNLHRDEKLIALHWPTFEQRIAEARLSLPASALEVKKLLTQSKSRKFTRKTIVNCVDGKARHCWVFEKPLEEKTDVI